METRNQKLESRNREDKRSEYGAGVKSIETKRLAKGSPPTRSERARSSATLSAETAERVGHPTHAYQQDAHFDRGRTTSYTDPMEVKLSPELQAKLDSIAAQQGRDSASLVREAVERLIGYDEWFMRQVEEGLAQIERGEVLKPDQVAAPMEKIIAEKQRRS